MKKILAGELNYNKYRVGDITKRKYKGIVFSSIKEKNRYIELELLMSIGEIKKLKRQIIFTIYPSFFDKQNKSWNAIRYRADFVYEDSNGNTIVEDVKGFMTQEYKLKRILIAKYCDENDMIFREFF